MAFFAPAFVSADDERLYNPITGELMASPFCSTPAILVQQQSQHVHFGRSGSGRSRTQQRPPQSHRVIDGPQGFILDPLTGQPVAHVQRRYHVVDQTPAPQYTGRGSAHGGGRRSDSGDRRSGHHDGHHQRQLADALQSHQGHQTSGSTASANASAHVNVHVHVSGGDGNTRAPHVTVDSQTQAHSQSQSHSGSGSRGHSHPQSFSPPPSGYGRGGMGAGTQRPQPQSYGQNYGQTYGQSNGSSQAPVSRSNPADQLSPADLMNAVFARRGGFTGSSAEASSGTRTYFDL